MKLRVNGVHLYVDVEGAGLVPEGPVLRERPTVVLLHGGPGFDHSIFKPAYSALTDTAQLVYIDHRGNGRSDPAASDTWNLAQWGDDVRGVCDALGIVRPIVVGVSFGGMVAMSYALRHPGHAAGLVLVSTEAQGTSYRERRVELFERLGGPEVGALARRRFIDRDTSPATLEAWVRLAMPHYMRRPPDPEVKSRGIFRPDALRWFTRPGGEGQGFDFLPDLPRIACPVLVMGGEDDPMTPIEAQLDIAAALPDARLERFPGCGHAIIPDRPEALDSIRRFVAGL